MSAPQPAPDRDAELLRQFLAGRDVPCSECSYNLRDLATPKCPECGTVLHLQVATKDGRTRLWTWMLSGAVFGEGFCACIWGFVLWDYVRSGRTANIEDLWPPIIGGVLELGVIIIVITSRRQFSTASRRIAYESVAGVWLFTLAIIFGTYYYIR